MENLIFLILFVLISYGVEGGPNERKLLDDLLVPYHVLERPVPIENETLQVSFGLTLMQIIDVDEKDQVLTTNVWLNLEWTDYNLKWNVSEYGGVDNIRIHPTKLWKPDVLMYNSADEGFDGTFATNIVVRNNGSCLYVPPGIFKSTCKIDITWFPFDDQRCDMKVNGFLFSSSALVVLKDCEEWSVIGWSWTYDGFQLDLSMKSDDGGDLSSFITNGEWELIGMPGRRNVNYYACCPEAYIDVTYTIHVRRRTLYYFFNLIVPCVLISSMALLGFTLPPDSGEKLTLGVTILLSLTVFLNIVAEKMPSTSDAVPLIGVTILLSLTVFLNLVAETLPQVSDAIPLLGITILLSLTVFSMLVADLLPKTSDAIPLLGTYFNCIMFMVASSVVLTVVVLNYHHRTANMHEMPPWVKTVFLQWLPWILKMSRPGRKITRKTIREDSKMKVMKDIKERSSKSLLANVLDMDDDIRMSSSYLRMETSDMSSPCALAQRDLQGILREIRFITGRMRKADEDSEVVGDWKFAAMVVDRMCLIVFTSFTIIATVAVLLSAPHIIVQ